ncbi:HAD family hydrolase [Nocardioides coralli]|uniref:HAD family hydrolase n=1 Tax=Nocardioides coralli TaxID=2872154 RepID=UPI001CA41D92|nr:HAD family hydrolase [Nocardioides coralli]QZY29272.1 HAD family hydrolase [Nocardioides coralli]
MRLPRLVATDLDGTLVRSDGTVSAYTHDVIAELDARGVPVVFVTGRPLRWAEEVFDYVGHHGLAVISNGALVWDVARDRVDLTRSIAVDDGVAACELIRSAIPDTSFAVETLAGIALEPGFLERHRLPEGSPRGPLADIFDAPALKLLARHERLGPQEFWDAAQEAVGDRLVVTWSSTGSLLEMSAPGVTKASTLAQVCDRLGVDRLDVVAFGDMPNDLPMLEWAGTAYAMANAHPSVLAAADHVAPDHDEDGVARVLAGLYEP